MLVDFMTQKYCCRANHFHIQTHHTANLIILIKLKRLLVSFSRLKDEEVLTGVKKDSATNLALAFNFIESAWYGERGISDTYKQLHFRNLLVNFLHELNDKIDQFVLQHLFGVVIRDEEGDIIALIVIRK